jgi:hypothetical protein
MSNGQSGGMQSLPTPASQYGSVQPLQPQNNYMGGQQTQPMYSNQQPGPMLPQAMQPSQTAGAQMQPGYGNQFGHLPPQSMPMPGMQFAGMQPSPMPGAQLGMQFAGMQPSPMPGAQPGMMYAQQMPGAQFGGMPQQQMYGRQMASQYAYVQQSAAQYYNQGRPTYGYPGANDLSQNMYGLSMQDSSYAGMNSSYQTTPSSSPSMGQPIRPSKPEDKLFGDLLSIAKTKQNRAS